MSDNFFANTKMPFIKISRDMLITKPAGEYGIGYDIDLFMEFCTIVNKHIASGNYSAALNMAEHYDHYILEMTSEARPLFVFTSSTLAKQHKTDASSFLSCLSKMLSNLLEYGNIMGADTFESPCIEDFNEQNKLNEEYDVPVHFSTQDEMNSFVELSREMFIDNRQKINTILPMCFDENTEQSITEAMEKYSCMTETLPSVNERAKRLAMSIAESSRIDPGNYHNDHFVFSEKIVSKLGISSGCEVFITHDHSSFKNGKNGFAITSEGIYLIETMSSRVQHISYDELSMHETEWEGSRFIIGDKRMLFPCRERDQALVYSFLNVIGRYGRLLYENNIK